jgi:CheY-like chemotaxis protein
MKLNRRAGATILLADDDVTYGTALCDLLQLDGHAVRHVLDGEEAIACVREMGERLDLLVCDLLLPRKSGFEVIREVNDLDLPLRILAITGVYRNMREIHALRGLGVTGYVHKSQPFEHVLFRVSNLLFPSSDNRRGNPRVAIAVPVQFKVGELVSYGTSYNLSITGIYVRTNVPVVAGATCEMALALPTAGEMVRVHAEIAHSATPREVRGTAYPAGFGARFFAMSPLAEAAIRHFVDAIHAEETTGERPAFVQVEPAGMER